MAPSARTWIAAMLLILPSCGPQTFTGLELRQESIADIEEPAVWVELLVDGLRVSEVPLVDTMRRTCCFPPCEERMTRATVQPVNWCLGGIAIDRGVFADTEKILVIDVDDGVRYSGFIEVLDLAKQAGMRRILLAGGPPDALDSGRQAPPCDDQ